MAISDYRNIFICSVICTITKSSSSFTISSAIVPMNFLLSFSNTPAACSPSRINFLAKATLSGSCLVDECHSNNRSTLPLTDSICYDRHCSLTCSVHFFFIAAAAIVEPRSQSIYSFNVGNRLWAFFLNLN